MLARPPQPERRPRLVDPDDPDDADSDPAEDAAVFEPEAETAAVYEDVLAALDRGDPGPMGTAVAPEDAAG